jgi:2-methylcitrate dehydratase PrpD
MTSPVDFTHDLTFDDLPDDVVHHAIRCVKDLIGVAAAGTSTDLSRIIRTHAVENFAAGPSRSARLMFDGRAVSPAGAALANAMTIDSVDAHDGHPDCKGHVGVGILPAILALPEGGMTGREFLTRVVIGYELGSRLGQILHATVSDYHTSGAWCALASAALGARALGLDRQQTREAAGIAEYHGPRSQMMRVIDHPTMLKDGSGWGAMAGVSAALLAADGFTGAPALLMNSDEAAPYWADLGSRWQIQEQYFKPDPVCRWAQPPVQGIRDLKATHDFAGADIAHIEVATFHEAVRLAVREPADTEQAQYSLPWPTAVAAVHDAIIVDHIAGEGLRDPEVLRLSRGLKLIEKPAFQPLFPAKRLAEVVVVLNDGTRLESGPVEAHGSAEDPLSDAEVSAKFRKYASDRMGEGKASELESLIEDIASADNLSPFEAMIY